MELEDVQDKILQRLRETDIPNVFEVSVPAGFVLPKQYGVILPYALVSFGGLTPVAGRQKGITSVADDIKWTAVAVECVGNSPSDVRKVTKIVRATLGKGYIPDESWGELEEQLAGDYTIQQPDADLAPVRYATGIIFNTNANAVTS